ncbi:MAG: threonine synthase [Acidimicrobiia bacterium]|nr:threonine synthase [Acidimicrobiia bacterium]
MTSFLSTRGGDRDRSFSEILLRGLAPDGGLYVPEEWPNPEIKADDHAGMVAEVVKPFVDDPDLAGSISTLAAASAAEFRTPEVAPVVPIGDDLHLLELFWGPTLSFKDHALQLVGRLFDKVLEKEQRRMLVVGATSGDTGSAAIEGCRGRDNISVVMLYPEGRVTDFQRRQMTTVPDVNVTVAAVDGTFDDCQRMVKTALADVALAERLGLGAVNSINFARIIAQTGYYMSTAQRMGEPFDLVVPTGNFGNILAAWIARRFGAPIERLVVANNRNHGLHDLITTGRLVGGHTERTITPAMDVSVPSNLERLLFELSGRNPERIIAMQTELEEKGVLVIPERLRKEIAEVFSAGWVDDSAISETIGSTYRERGVLIDPHTATGLTVALQEKRAGVPMVVAATAHPVKFGEAVRAATGVTPNLPAGAPDPMVGEEREIRLEKGTLQGLLESIHDQSLESERFPG